MSDFNITQLSGLFKDSNMMLHIVTHEGTVASGSHTLLTDLNVDSHTQYLNDTRGDARYYLKSEVDTISGSLNNTIDALDYFSQAEVTSLVTTASGSLNDAIEALDFYTTVAVDTLLLGKEDVFTEVDGGSY